MVIIKINRKPLKIAITIILICSLGFNIYALIENLKIKNRYESVINIINQVDRTNLISFVAPIDSLTLSNKIIEIFDINHGKVIRRVQSTPLVQKEVKGYLNGITGMYIKVKAFPEKGHILKIPMEPAVKVHSKWLKAYGINLVDEVFILFPEEGTPYLLVLDEKKRPLFYNFEGETNTMLSALNFELETS
jgi:hypothetical protein